MELSLLWVQVRARVQEPLQLCPAASPASLLLLQGGCWMSLTRGRGT